MDCSISRPSHHPTLILHHMNAQSQIARSRSTISPTLSVQIRQPNQLLLPLSNLSIYYHAIYLSIQLSLGGGHRTRYGREQALAPLPAPSCLWYHLVDPSRSTASLSFLQWALAFFFLRVRFLFAIVRAEEGLLRSTRRDRSFMCRGLCERWG